MHSGLCFEFHGSTSFDYPVRNSLCCAFSQRLLFHLICQFVVCSDGVQQGSSAREFRAEFMMEFETGYFFWSFKSKHNQHQRGEKWLLFARVLFQAFPMFCSEESMHRDEALDC